MGTQLLEVVRQAWPLVGPRHDVEQLVEALGVELVRLDQAVREQMQAQVGIVRVDSRLGQILNGRAHCHLLHAAILVQNHLTKQLWGQISSAEPVSARFYDLIA